MTLGEALVSKQEDPFRMTSAEVNIVSTQEDPSGMTNAEVNIVSTQEDPSGMTNAEVLPARRKILTE